MRARDLMNAGEGQTQVGDEIHETDNWDPCPNCGVDVRADMDECWDCGADMEGHR